MDVFVFCDSNARVRKCTCRSDCSNRTFLDSHALLGPCVTIRNVDMEYLFVCVVCLLILVEQHACCLLNTYTYATSKSR